MKLVISKNKEGNGYYSKIQNDYNGIHTEKILSIQVPKGNDLEYGLYEVDGFISTYQKKDGTTEFKFVLKDAVPISNPPKQKETKSEEQPIETDPFAEFGESIQIEDNMLD
jgi:hypothetical protein